MPRKRPFAVQRYRYIITDIETGDTHQCVREPEGWDAYGVTFGRETGISNVVKGYVSSWSFLKEDARWLRDMLLQYGPNRRLRMRVLDDATSLRTTSETVYVGDIDLTMAEWDGVKFTAPTSDGGFFKALENKWDDEFSIPFDRYCKIDGAVFSDSCHYEGIESIMTADFQRWRAHASVRRANAICNARRSAIEETAMQKEFTNDVEMEYVGFETVADDNSNALLNDPTNMTETNAFFVCRSQVVEKLCIDYKVKYTGRLVNLKQHNKTKHPKHRLCIYGIPMSRYKDNDENQPAIWYAHSSKNAIYQGPGEGYIYEDAYDFSHVSGNVPYNNPGVYSTDSSKKQFFAVLAECNDTVVPKKVTETDANGNSSKIWTALHTATFEGTFALTNFDTHDGDGMAFFLVVDFDIEHPLKDDSTFEIKTIKNSIDTDFALRLNTGKMIAAIKAADAFRAIINKISNGRYNITFDTSAFDVAAENDMLTMHEGMRNKFISARNRRFGLHGSLTTSLSDFLKYAYAVYGIQIGVAQNGAGYTVILARFESMYEGTSVIGQISDFNDLQFNIDRDKLYSTLKVGYDVENDTLNGEKEYNNLQVWNTPNTEIEGNELDLTSPYCASSKAIETYLYNNYHNADDKSREDKDVYLIDAAYSYDYQWESNGPVHELTRFITVLAGITYPDTQWNLKYTPKRMLHAHAVELNSLLAFEAGKLITLETCDLNRSLVSYDGTPPSSWTLTPVAQGGGIQQGLKHGYPAGSIIEAKSVTIGTNRVFVPVTVSFNAIAGRKWIKMIEANRLGVIEVRNGGNTLRGFISDGDSSITVNPIKESESEFKLLLSKI